MKRPPLVPTARLVGVLIAVALLLAAGAGGTLSPANAQGTTTLSIDAIPTDNTPTSVMRIDTCASAGEGDTFAVDLVIESVTDLLAWELIITYDPEVLEVQDHDAEMFQAANPGSEVIDLSEETPDDDGRYLLQSFDSADPDSPDSGSGVLARLTFKAIGPGVSPLTIDKLDLNSDGTLDQGPLLRDVAGDIIGDDDGDTLFDGPVKSAEIRVGEPCPSVVAVATILSSGASGSVSLGVGIGVILASVAAVALAIALVTSLRRRRTGES